MQTAVFASAITNIVFNGYRTASCTRKITFSAGSFSEVWDTGTLVGTSLSDFLVAEFLPEDNVTSFRLRNHSGGQNFYLKTITVYTADPPPSLGPIPNQTIGSANTIDNLPLYVTTSVSGETPSVSATTTSAIPSASYEAFEENGDWFFRFSPADAGITFGNIDFTVSATGIGGTTNLTFTVTVEEGVVKTPPAITLPIASTNAIALRDLIVPFTIHEADGDQVETNVVCITEGVTGPYGHDGNGTFSYTPSLEDADLPQPITFGIAARDIEGAVTNYFNVTVTAGTPPVIGPIAPQTVTYDDMNEVTLALTPTEDDDITWTNVAVKAGTTDPIGEHTFSDLVFRFVPAADDIGKTFTFEATAEDRDGTMTNEFDVSVVLATPVLKHCPIEEWTATSFTADIENEIPGAEGYDLRYFYVDDQNVEVVVTTNNVTFPCVVGGLLITNYTYSVRAFRDGVFSAWSDAKAIDLASYKDFVAAIQMTGVSRGTYTVDFNELGEKHNTNYRWYDGRTIPGCYASKGADNINEGLYKALNTMGTSTGVYSIRSVATNSNNRCLVFRNESGNEGGKFRFGVVFTNCCRYAVTNINVSYSGMQPRVLGSATSLSFQYYVSSNSITSCSSGTGYKYSDKVEALKYTEPETGGNYELNPPSATPKKADIALTGDDMLKPGWSIILRWNVDGNSSNPAIGIDDITVEWRCAWPGHTVIYVR